MTRFVKIIAVIIIGTALVFAAVVYGAMNKPCPEYTWNIPGGF